MIFGELLGNVARHTPGTADVELEIIRDRAYLHVTDEGRPFARSANGPETFAESGRGLLLVESLARRLSIARTVRGNCVSVELPIAIDEYGEPAALEFHQERNGALRPGIVEVYREFAEHGRN